MKKTVKWLALVLAVCLWIPTLPVAAAPPEGSIVTYEQLRKKTATEFKYGESSISDLAREITSRIGENEYTIVMSWTWWCGYCGPRMQMFVNSELLNRETVKMYFVDAEMNTHQARIDEKVRTYFPNYYESTNAFVYQNGKEICENLGISGAYPTIVLLQGTGTDVRLIKRSPVAVDAIVNYVKYMEQQYALKYPQPDPVPEPEPTPEPLPEDFSYTVKENTATVTLGEDTPKNALYILVKRNEDGSLAECAVLSESTNQTSAELKNGSNFQLYQLNAATFEYVKNIDPKQ